MQRLPSRQSTAARAPADEIVSNSFERQLIRWFVGLWIDGFHLHDFYMTYRDLLILR